MFTARFIAVYSPPKIMLFFSSRAFSASDLCNEFGYPNLLAQATLTQPQEFTIEAVPAHCYKLQSQYLLLPKAIAFKHGIFAGQPLQLSRVDMERGDDERGRTLSDIILDLGPIPGKEMVEAHLAVTKWYEDEASLQKYVPAPSLQHHYDEESLQVAYIHPELLFSLFPETLAHSRRFHIKVAVSCARV